MNETCCQGSQMCCYIAGAIGFLLGVIVTCIVCKLRKGKCVCAKKGAKGDKKPMAKKGEERPFEKRKPHPAPADGSVEIYVGNLSYDMTEDQLRETFEKYGKVSNVRLVMNRYNGKSKGFGFVQMPDRAEAEKACEALNDTDVMGRKMKCNEAKNLV